MPRSRKPIKHIHATRTTKRKPARRNRTRKTRQSAGGFTCIINPELESKKSYYTIEYEKAQQNCNTQSFNECENYSITTQALDENESNTDSFDDTLCKLLNSPESSKNNRIRSNTYSGQISTEGGKCLTKQTNTRRGLFAILVGPGKNVCASISNEKECKSLTDICDWQPSNSATNLIY